MAYNKQNFNAGDILKASQLNAMDAQIAANEVALEGKQPKGNYLTSSDLNSKQDKLVSGVNIKTVNGQSILGVGNLVLSNSTTNVIPKPVSSTFYNGKKIAMIGDSITQGVGASDSSKRYTTVLAGLLGATEVNLGQSGTVLCTGGNRGCNIGKLSVGNLNGCSVVTIMMGINDWDQAGDGYYELGEYGSTDTTTIYGAVDMWCKKVVEIRETSGFENTKFFFITPIITSWNHSVGGTDWSQEKTNIHGYKLRDICQAIINVCADYKIPVLDMNKYSGIYYNSAEDNSVSTYFGDGIHPNTAGHEQIAKALKEYLLKNPTYVETDEALNFVLQSLLGESTKISYPNFDNVETLFVALESIALTPSAISLTEGEKTTVIAKLTPTNTTQTSLKWESSNTSVATVADGVVTAMAEGSVTITCKSVNNSSISATATVAVSKATSTDLTGLLISESTKTVTQGQTATLSVSYVPSATTQKGVTWSSDNTAVATVVGNGDSCTVTAVGGGQCNITATSTVNSSIKASCFFTTTEQAEGGDGGDSSSYDLGSSVTLNADGTLVGKGKGAQYGQAASRALYKIPLKAGMEVEVQHTFSSGYNGFVGWGVDNVSSLSELKNASGGQFPSGLFVVYYDSPANVNAVQTYPSQGAVNQKSTLVSTGNKTSPRIAVLKRDANGVLSGTFNGTEMTMPSSYTGLQTANESEDLYVWIGGIDSDSTWKINYFGESRDISTEPEEPETPETPTPDTPTEPDTPDSGTWTLGKNVNISEDGLISGTAPGSAYSSDDNAAIYNVPLKAGMEVEIVQTIPSGYNQFLGWGVDASTTISELKHSGNFLTGMFSFYIDAGKDNVQSLNYGSISPKIELGVNGGQTSPRISVIKRDENGVLSAIFGGNAVTMPSHDGVTSANATEDLYVWIGGIDSSSTWKINYFGELRN